MKTDIINAPLALATRVVLILGARPNTSRSEQTLIAIDLLTTHAASYGVGKTNLHGDVQSPSIELAARTFHMRKGIRYAGTRGWISAAPTPQGWEYKITELGTKFRSRIDAQYVIEYDFSLGSVLPFIETHTEKEIQEKITQQNFRRTQ